MKMYKFVIPSGAYGGDRYEYTCKDCYARAFDMWPMVKRVEVHQARADEKCPLCGKAAS